MRRVRLRTPRSPHNPRRRRTRRGWANRIPGRRELDRARGRAARFGGALSCGARLYRAPRRATGARNRPAHGGAAPLVSATAGIARLPARRDARRVAPNRPAHGGQHGSVSAAAGIARLPARRDARPAPDPASARSPAAAAAVSHCRRAAHHVDARRVYLGPAVSRSSPSPYLARTVVGPVSHVACRRAPSPPRSRRAAATGALGPPVARRLVVAGIRRRQRPRRAGASHVLCESARAAIPSSKENLRRQLLRA